MRNETRKHRERRLAGERRREAGAAGVVAGLMAGGEDDELLTQIALRRIDDWGKAPAGTAYDNREIREIAKEARKAGL